MTNIPCPDIDMFDIEVEGSFHGKFGYEMDTVRLTKANKKLICKLVDQGMKDDDAVREVAESSYEGAMSTWKLHVYGEARFPAYQPIAIQPSLTSAQEVDRLEIEREKMQEDFTKKMRELMEMQEKVRTEITENIAKTVQNPAVVKTYTLFLTPFQYQYFLKNISKLDGMYYHVDKVDNTYNVSIQYGTDEQRAKVIALQDEITQQQKQPSKKTRNPSGMDDILTQLCQSFQQSSGNPCGLSRTGALKTLARRIAQTYEDSGRDWKTFDISTVDMFVHNGDKIYSKEQADEAYNNWVKNQHLQTVEESNADICDSEFEASAFLEYYSMLRLSGKRSLTPEESADMQKAKNDLVRYCAFSDGKFQVFYQRARSLMPYEIQGIER